MKRFISILIIIAVIALVTLSACTQAVAVSQTQSVLQTPSPEPEPTSTPQPLVKMTPSPSAPPEEPGTGQLPADSAMIFNANFDANLVSYFMTPLTGTWNIVDDGTGNKVLQTANLSKGFNQLKFGPPDFTDGVIQYRFKYKEWNPSLRESGLEYIFFRSGTAWGANSYTLQVGPSFNAAILTYVPGNMDDNWLDLDGKQMDVQKNQWYRVRIEIKGNHILVLINDQLAMDETDAHSRAQSGRISFQVGPETTVQFDDIQVWQTQTTNPTVKPAQTLVPMDQFMKGVVYFGSGRGAYNTSVSDWNLINVVKPLGVNWVRLNIVCRQKSIESTEINCNSWSAQDDWELRHVVKLAHQLGLRVMFDFSLFLDDDNGPIWHGMIGQKYTEGQWDAWFKSYTENLLLYTKLAEENQVDVMNIGSELGGTTQREKQWRAVVAAVRQVYHGQVTYSSDTQIAWTSMSWWDAVDFIGLHPYNYNITNSSKTSLDEMKVAWKPIVASWETLSLKWNKPIVITEIGYPSYDGIGHQGYFPDNYHVNLKESADLYQALIESLAGKPWFHGFFPYGIHTENPSEPNNIDYLIYGKPSENVIRTFYGAPTLPAPTPYPEPPADFQKKMVIYDDQMESGWTHAGTTNLVDLSQTQIAKSGSAIKVNIDPFNELTFKHEPYIDFSQYQWLAFDLFVPKQGTHPLVVEVYLRDPNFYSMPFRIVLTYSHYIEGGGIKEGQWQHALIPLSAFGPLFPPVKSIVLSLWYSGPATFYVDNVSLLGN